MHIIRLSKSCPSRTTYEIIGQKAIWTWLDKKQNGTLGPEERKQLIVGLGLSKFKWLDSNDDGLLTYDNFIAALDAIGPPDSGPLREMLHLLGAVVLGEGIQDEEDVRRLFKFFSDNGKLLASQFNEFGQQLEVPRISSFAWQGELRLVQFAHLVTPGIFDSSLFPRGLPLVFMWLDTDMDGFLDCRERLYLARALGVEELSWADPTQEGMMSLSQFEAMAEEHLAPEPQELLSGVATALGCLDYCADIEPCDPEVLQQLFDFLRYPQPTVNKERFVGFATRCGWQFSKFEGEEWDFDAFCAALLRLEPVKAISDIGAQLLFASRKGNSLRSMLSAGEAPSLPSSTASSPKSSPRSEQPYTTAAESSNPASRENASYAVALLSAAGEGDVATLQELLSSGMPADSMDPSGVTPLMVAAAQGYEECVRVLLEANADARRVDGDHANVLHRAAQAGYPNIVQLLVDAKAQVGCKNIYGVTPLMVAIYNGSEECVRSLLEAGADAEAHDSDGSTALHTAVENDHLNILHCILSFGNNVDCENLGGRTPLMTAVHCNKADFVELLVQAGADVHHRDAQTASALHLAARKGHVNMLQMLLDAGADVDCQDRHGATPLMVAAEVGSVECVQFLLEAAADVNLQDECGSTALHLAVPLHHLSIIQVLLEAGADTDCRDNEGFTPLMKASSTSL